MPFDLHKFKFAFLDTEYRRPDYRRAPVDKLDVSNIQLFSIQVAEFRTSDLKREKIPSLEVLSQLSFGNEVGLLKKFWKTWKRFFGNVENPDRLIPIGFVVGTDLQILANKYGQYLSEMKSHAPSINQRYVSVPHVLQNSRFFDLQWPLQFESNILDIKLPTSTKANSISNKDIPSIIDGLLSPNCSPNQQRNLQKRFDTYVYAEYEVFFQELKLIYQKLNTNN